MRLRAARAGPIALQALSDGATGRVHSVFERSAYLSIRNQLICLGPPALGNGPLNLLCEDWPSRGSGRAALRVNDSIRVHRHLLQAGPALAVSLAGAEPWNPRPIGEWDRHRLSAGLVALDEALPVALLEEGLAPLVCAGRERLDDELPVVRAARAAARELSCWVAKGIAGRPDKLDAATIAPLIGLGPGLTPSGDDFLGAALIALSLLSESGLQLQLWQTVQPLLPALSNDISAAHLAAAAGGLGSDALHDLLGAVVTGRVDLVPVHVGAVASIGHTSGVDAIAGAVTVLRAASGRDAISSRPTQTAGFGERRRTPCPVGFPAVDDSDP
jgi:Protein of unknown function (DUF2877)